MDRDAGTSDRGEEARQGDTGMIGSESEEPGPGRDTSLAGPVVGQESYAQEVDDAGPSDSAAFADEPVARERPAFAIDDAGAPDRSAVADDDPARWRPDDGR